MSNPPRPAQPTSLPRLPSFLLAQHQAGNFVRSAALAAGNNTAALAPPALAGDIDEDYLTNLEESSRGAKKNRAGRSASLTGVSEGITAMGPLQRRVARDSTVGSRLRAAWRCAGKGSAFPCSMAHRWELGAAGSQAAWQALLVVLSWQRLTQLRPKIAPTSRRWMTWDV